jgi:hypothetical protein
MQVRRDIHTSQAIYLKEAFEIGEGELDEDDKRFFKLFQESTFEGSRAAALEMRKIAERQIECNQKSLLFHSLRVLARSDSEMLSWPNSPLLVLLQFIDLNVMFGDNKTTFTPLHALADLTNPSDYSTHVNQLILAKQLIMRDANLDAVSPRGGTPLHGACYAGKVTNLDFVELLLEEGADPNSQNHLGETPLMCTTPHVPGTAKFLLNWPTTDVSITTRSGESFLVRVRSAITAFSDQPDNLDQVPRQFLLQQWREIEEMLVETGAHDTVIPTIE